MSIFLHIASKTAKRSSDLLPRARLIKTLSQQEATNRAGKDNANSQAGDAAAEIASDLSWEGSRLYHVELPEQYNPKGQL